MSAKSVLDLFRLDGKVALVTGASRGLGRAMARALAAAGADVALVGRDPATLAPVEQEIESELGREALAVPLDVSLLETIPPALDVVVQRFGRLDILVNNAATNPYFGPAIGVTPEVFQKTVDVNIRGCFFATAQAVGIMARGGGGAIVNIASIAGLVPGPDQGLYSITKAAVIAMTKVFAAECAAAGVRVNAVLPGITDTRFAAALVEDDTMRARYLARVPLGRVAQPAEMAAAVLYLASPAASYTTGTCLPVDGGYLVH